MHSRFHLSRIHAPTLLTRTYTTNLLDHFGPRRALIYRQSGAPNEVLSVTSDATPLRVKEGEIAVKFLIAPINPADLNVIEGVYPAKPLPTSFGGSSTSDKVFIAGHEGLAQVIYSSTDALKKGDWVIPRKSHSGTWMNWNVVSSRDMLKLPVRDKTKLGEVFAGTLMVNWLTAWGLLKDIYDASPGEWVLQNGANSGVGQALIQIAHQKGIKTLNFIRPRPDIDFLKSYLTSLGASHVFTYEDLLSKDSKKHIAGLLKGEGARVAINCIGGPSATGIASLLRDGHLISYGGMSKEPLKIPVGLQIFKNLTCHGYWHSRRWPVLSPEEQEMRMNRLIGWKEEGKLREGLHQIVTLKGSDEEATENVRGALKRLEEGQTPKVLLKWE